MPAGLEDSDGLADDVVDDVANDVSDANGLDESGVDGASGDASKFGAEDTPAGATMLTGVPPLSSLSDDPPPLPYCATTLVARRRDEARVMMECMITLCCFLAEKILYI